MNKVDWTQTAHCQTRAHCRECLTGAYEGTTTEERYEIPEECPFGVSLENLPEPKQARRPPLCVNAGDRHEARSCMRWCEKEELWMKSSKCPQRDCYET